MRHSGPGPVVRGAPVRGIPVQGASLRSPCFARSSPRVPLEGRTRTATPVTCLVLRMLERGIRCRWGSSFAPGSGGPAETERSSVPIRVRSPRWFDRPPRAQGRPAISSSRCLLLSGCSAVLRSDKHRVDGEPERVAWSGAALVLERPNTSLPRPRAQRLPGCEQAIGACPLVSSPTTLHPVGSLQLPSTLPCSVPPSLTS